jgi:glucosamine-6-phosphate deaminase
MTGNSPEVRVVASADAAVPILLDEIRRVVGTPAPLIGLANGVTYGKVWGIFAAELDTRAMSSDFVLTHPDEYLGFGPEDHGGTVHELVTLCPQIGGLVRDGRFFCVPSDGGAESIAAHERRIVRCGGFALQFLGLGRNGHLASNEPGTPFDSHVHVATIAECTRADLAARFAAATVPRQAVTIGIGTMLGARRLVLCAFGTAKVPAVGAMMHGAVDPACPASALRRHGNALIVLDREAAVGLDEKAAPKGA